MAMPACNHVIWGRIDAEMDDSAAERSIVSDSEERNLNNKHAPIAEHVCFLTPSDTEQSGGEVGMTSRKNSQEETTSTDAQGIQEQLHKQGSCSPCVYIASQKMCLLGASCDFCHQSHAKQEAMAPPRPRKSKRAQCKKVADQLDVLAAEDPKAFVENVKLLLCQGSYMRTVVKSKLKGMGREDIGDLSPNSAATGQTYVVGTQ